MYIAITRERKPNYELQGQNRPRECSEIPYLMTGTSYLNSWEIPQVLVHILLNPSWRSLHFNPRRERPKKVTRIHKGVVGDGQSDPFPLLLTPFIRFGTYNELSLYFQLIEATWCLIGFHDNHNHTNDVTSSHHLRFSNFQIFFIFELNTEDGEKTATLSDWNLKNCKIRCKVVSI